jgi:hypothetical protein
MSEAIKRLGGDQGGKEDRYDNGRDEPQGRGARVLRLEPVNRSGLCWAGWIIGHGGLAA